MVFCPNSLFYAGVKIEAEISTFCYSTQISRNRTDQVPHLITPSLGFYSVPLSHSLFYWLGIRAGAHKFLVFFYFLLFPISIFSIHWMLGTVWELEENRTKFSVLIIGTIDNQSPLLLSDSPDVKEEVAWHGVEGQSVRYQEGAKPVNRFMLVSRGRKMDLQLGLNLQWVAETFICP